MSPQRVRKQRADSSRTTTQAKVTPGCVIRAGSRGTLACADNLPFMAELPQGSCDLIYIDPPFNSQRRRTTAFDPNGFDDRWSGAMNAYLDFLRPRLQQMYRLLGERGSLYVHLDWRAVHYVKVVLDEIFGPDNFLNEIIWRYRTGGRSNSWFARKHDTILLYARQAGRHVFNVQHEGSFRTDGLIVDEDGRPYKNTRKGRLYFDKRGPAMSDVWNVPFLSTVSTERTGYPSQKPMALLRRVIAASSGPGDLVADFFCGSGTTLAVADEMQRRWIGCDIEPEAVRIAATRLRVDGAAAPPLSGPRLPEPRP